VQWLRGPILGSVSRDSGFGIDLRAGQRKRGSTHDISLCSNGNKSIDMFTNRNQHLPSHVSTLFCPRSLVLDMYPRCSLLYEQFRELHHGCQTTMSSVRICDDGAEIINVGELGAVRFGFRGDAFFTLLAVVEELGHEEMGDFVWDGGLES
jgi:hypothetical protein